MDQRELVRSGNVTVPDRYVIVTVMHLHDPESLIAESRQFGAIVTDWFRARGTASDSIVLAAVAEKKFHGAIVEWFAQVHARDVTLRPIFQSVPFRIELHDPQGKPVGERQFSPEPPPKAGFFSNPFGGRPKK